MALLRHRNSTLEEAFKALEEATVWDLELESPEGRNEENEDSRSSLCSSSCQRRRTKEEVAAKYLYACHLLDKAGSDLDVSDKKSGKVLLLVHEKSSHYKKRAHSLLEESRDAEWSVNKSVPRSVCARDLDLNSDGENAVENKPKMQSSTREIQVLCARMDSLADVTAKFSSACNLDQEGRREDAIEDYIAAAGGYLNALRAGRTSKCPTKVRKTVHHILDRVEALKQT